MKGVAVIVAPGRVIAFASLADSRLDRPAETAAAPRPAIVVERVTFRALIAHQIAWSDLVERALEPNVFLDPAFALPLFQHVRFAARPDILLAWEEDGPATFGRLVGLFPVRVPPWRWWLAHGFHHEQIALGTPLLDRERGHEAFAAMLAWLGAAHPHCAGLVLSAIPARGAFAAALRAMGGRTIEPLATHRRAILRAGAPDRPDHFMRAGQRGPGTLSPKRRKELRRQRRRLSTAGSLTYHSARSPAEIRRAAERFLALEHDGWKGRRGSALLGTPTLATFTRTMTRLMAHEGRCRIDSLEIDGRPIAMGILVMAGSVAHFWKTTFDERYAALSPGVHFVLDLTERQAVDVNVTLTDSCAVPDHPMIDRLWSDRMEIADLAIALKPLDGRFAAAVWLETTRRWLRGLAKATVLAGRRLLDRRSASH